MRFCRPTGKWRVTMPTAVAWRGVFLERLKATGNVALAAVGAGVTRQNAWGGNIHPRDPD